MAFFNLRNLWRRPNRAGRSWSRRVRPRVEGLEDRVVLSTIVDLGTVGGLASAAAAVNASGQVVGWSDDASGAVHAFLYNAGVASDLGTLGGQTSSATGINAAGQVVGVADNSSGVQSAFLDDGEGMTFLGTLGGPASYASAINAAGQVVGFASLPAGASGTSLSHAFLYKLGTMTDLGTLGGDASSATAINASGQVAGFSQTAAGAWHAFLDTAGTMKDLGTLSGYDSFATGINDAGQVIGEFDTLLDGAHAFLFSHGTMTDLGKSYLANGIDSEGEVVGSGPVGTSGATHAMVFHGGSWLDLNDYLPANSGWVLSSATAVTDAGQVVGQGTINGAQHAFLMTLPATVLSQPSLSVTSPFDLNPSPTVFGPYLPGANLNVPFTVSLTNDPHHVVASVEWSLDGGTLRTARPAAAAATWTFGLNVGLLSTANHTLSVTGYDAAGQPLSGVAFKGTLRVRNLPLAFSLLATPHGGSATDVTHLRFLQSVPLTTTFLGTIDGLPSYYQNSTVKVLLGQQPMTITAVNLGGESLGFQFTLNAGTLPAGTTPVSVAVGSVALSRFGIPSQPVMAVAEPGWLKTGHITFDGAHGTYHFAHVQPTVQLTTAAAPARTHLGWLDSKWNGYTGVRLTPDLSVAVSLDPTQQPIFAVNLLQIRAWVLGQPVWNQTYAPADLTVGGQIDSQTVTPSGLTIALAQPALLGPQTLVNSHFAVTYPATSPLKSVTANLGLPLGASSVTANAGLEFDWKNNTVTLNPTGTFFQLSASATGKSTTAAIAAIAHGWSGGYTALASLALTLGLTGTDHFGGILSAPILATGSDLHASLTGRYGYSVKGTQAVTGTPIDSSVDVPIGPAELF